MMENENSKNNHVNLEEVQMEKDEANNMKQKKKIPKWLKIVGCVIVGGLAIGAVACLSNEDSDYNLNESDENDFDYEPEPLLSAKAYNNISKFWGEEEAENISEMVKNGDIPPEQFEHGFDRPDIEPEDWQMFEEGWRPDGWYEE